MEPSHLEVTPEEKQLIDSPESRNGKDYSLTYRSQQAPPMVLVLIELTWNM